MSQAETAELTELIRRAEELSIQITAFAGTLSRICRDVYTLESQLYQLAIRRNPPPPGATSYPRMRFMLVELDTKRPVDQSAEAAAIIDAEGGFRTLMPAR